MNLQGKTLNNSVFLERFIDEGAAGEVYYARIVKAIAGLEIGDNVAAKVYKPQIIDYPHQKERIKKEFKIGAAITHPNLVKVYHLDSDKIGDLDRPYLLMEYVEGTSLREYVKTNYPLSDKKIADLFKQLTSGVFCFHKNRLIHRDIKPDNIMVSNNGRLKLMDLGVVKDLRSSTLTYSDQFLGTIRYAAPEYLFDLNASEESDAYSCGAVLYFMIYSDDIFSAEKLFSNVILKISSENITLKSPKRNSSKKLVLLLEITRRLILKKPNERITLKSAINEIKSSYTGRLWNDYIMQLIKYRIASIWQKWQFNNLPLFPDKPANFIPFYLFFIPDEYYENAINNLAATDWVKIYLDENVEAILHDIKMLNKIIAIAAIKIDLVEWKNRFTSSTSTADKIGLLRSLLLRYIMGVEGGIEETLDWVKHQTNNAEVLSFCYECLLSYGNLEIHFNEGG